MHKLIAIAQNIKVNGETEPKIQKLALVYSYYDVDRTLDWSLRAPCANSNSATTLDEPLDFTAKQRVGYGQDTKILREIETGKPLVALTRWLIWLEHRSLHQKSASLIPVQSPYP